MAKRIDWDKVHRNRKAWFRQPWEDAYKFWRGYEFHQNKKTFNKKQKSETIKQAPPQDKSALLRFELPKGVWVEVPHLSKGKFIEGKYIIPKIKFEVLFLDYLCPNLPSDIRNRLLGTLEELNKLPDKMRVTGIMEERLLFLTRLEEWRYDHGAKHLEIRLVARKKPYRFASIIWPSHFKSQGQ